MGSIGMATPPKKKSGTGSENRKKTVPQRGKKNKRVKKSARKPLNQGLLSLLILFAFVLVLGILAHIYLKPSGTPSEPGKTPGIAKEIPVKTKPPEKPVDSRPPEKTPGSSSGSIVMPQDIPVYEIPVKDDPVVKRDPPPTKTSGKPKVAIIIDDIGYDAVFADKLMALGIPITFSILPGSPHGVEIAKKAHEKGFEVMLHQPMEPLEYPKVNPGPGVILMKMGADQSIAVLEKNLKSIPHIRGVNNHMGSRLTRSEKHMNQIFTVLKRENLFFIDSLTASKSLGKASARLFKLPFASRDIFFDHVQTRAFVEKQTSELIRLSQKYGSAIGIGHPYSVTLEVLQKRIPKEKDTVDFVYASELVEIVKN